MNYCQSLKEISAISATKSGGSLCNGFVSGKLPAGARLRETDLANQLGVSRVPVREAIRVLEVEGLVSTVARGGVFVASLSFKDVQDFFEVSGVRSPF
ncbi:GntR family transcriptional regulator [Arthrobacter sp. StoSoilB5]|uniref:GntR family transcriptional regulator n=1 Tax=Arthrobacter sp. StoSoilB5 TaxID=2830992 RepID=UPI001CC5DF87|nr:GntR family transcriptional regulator [Arthrobacter sp. StoSoilB5]BCW44710.1 hypothetical protein StoSoilB5_18940 [Arthrobacter sp. StoSoilB5]